MSVLERSYEYLSLERTMRSQDAARAMKVFQSGGKCEWKGE